MLTGFHTAMAACVQSIPACSACPFAASYTAHAAAGHHPYIPSAGPPPPETFTPLPLSPPPPPPPPPAPPPPQHTHTHLMEVLVLWPYVHDDGLLGLLLLGSLGLGEGRGRPA